VNTIDINLLDTIHGIPNKKKTKKPVEITNTNKCMIVETKEDSDETIKNDCLDSIEFKK